MTSTIFFLNLGAKLHFMVAILCYAKFVGKSNPSQIPQSKTFDTN